MAAARQKEMKDNMTVEATTTFVVLEPGFEGPTKALLDPTLRDRSQVGPTRLADGLGLESTPSGYCGLRPNNLGSPVSNMEFVLRFLL